MICYAVIDTNVLVSALLSSKDDTATVQVLGKVITGEIIPVYSNVITKEYREVLSRRKFGFSADLIEHLMSAIEKYGILVMSVGRVRFQYPFLKRIQITAKGKRLPVTHDVPKAFISAVSTIFCCIAVPIIGPRHIRPALSCPLPCLATFCFRLRSRTYHSDMMLMNGANSPVL